jgi:ribose 5-phosphate isomerase B
MLIYIGSDHRGFTLKNGLKEYLKSVGYEIVDCGNTVYDEKDDYPDFAAAVARQVSKNPLARGIVLCGSGVGVAIVANKFSRVRCTLSFSPDHAVASRHDDDTNVIAIPADFVTGDIAKKIVSAWLQALFTDTDDYVRRLQKIATIEFETKSE